MTPIDAAGSEEEAEGVSVSATSSVRGRQALPVDPPRPVVLLMHGLMQTSECFLVDTPDRALAFYLFEAGCVPCPFPLALRRSCVVMRLFSCSPPSFDVWCGNNRGNKYSMKHTTLKPTSDAFWDFSIDELARFDAPAMVEVSGPRMRDVTSAPALCDAALACLLRAVAMRAPRLCVFCGVTASPLPAPRPPSPHTSM